MRTRLATIAALSLAAVIGTATAAQAGPPKGPGGMSDKPTTTTTAPPKGPDKVAPTPTTQPPKGPGDIAQPKPDNDPKPPKGPGDIAQPKPDNDPQPPKGPGDIAQPQPGPVVDPKGPQDKAPVPPKGGGTDTGGGKADTGKENDNGNGTSGDDGSDAEETAVEVEGATVETVPVADTEGPVANETTEAAAETDGDGGVSPLVLLGFAILTAGLIGFVVARRRDEDQDAEQF